MNTAKIGNEKMNTENIALSNFSDGLAPPQKIVLSTNPLYIEHVSTLQGHSMTQTIHSRMASILSEIGSISKDQKNSAQGFKFRGIDQFINALHPLLLKYQVYVRPRILNRKEQIVEVPKKDGGTRLEKHVSIEAEYIFTSDDGSQTVIGPVPGEGIDSGDKATNKALSAALKYALIQTFMVPTEDMVDADFDSPSITGNSSIPALKLNTSVTEATTVVTMEEKKSSSTFKRPPKKETISQGDDEWS